MSDVIAALSAARADHCAVYDSAGVVSYAELRAAMGRLQRSLTLAGATRVAVLADNGRAWAIADLALLECGITSVPLPTYFSAAQLAHALNDAAVDCVLTDNPRRIHELALAFDRHTENTEALVLLKRDLDPNIILLPADTAKITYTSGSTGNPKGVCLSQAAIEQVASSLHATTAALHLSRHLSLLPLPTLLENVAGLYVPLLSGAICCLPSLARTGVTYGGIDTRLLLHCIDEHEPESLVLVPELLRVLIAATAKGWRPGATLKYIAVGGARVSSTELDRAWACGLPVYEGYGLSECASVVCLNTPVACRPGSVGRPLPHAQLRIDDNGELHVRGAVMNGYVGCTARNNEEVATGDLAAIDADGYVFIHGRAKNLIITSVGRNISPEWIESELLQSGTIAQAMVVGEAHPHLGALIVGAAMNTHIERAIAAVNKQLPDYAQVRCWTRLTEPFSARSGLLTANGRLRRDAISARYAPDIERMFARSVRCG